ncbi:hypothetical protein [Streptomyces sp. NPDC046939]|uniref:hypothetical protein n=1 Tax=Streptomyces sp. NPDC046939 TaxID=3155376 RepID=UPI0033BFE597
MRRTSQTIAMNLRFYVYASEPGAFYNTYPNGSGARPVPVQYTEEERERHTQERDAAFAEWQEVDPEGYSLWREATAAMQEGDSSELVHGWSEMMVRRHGVRIVDPCRFCRSCRGRSYVR